MKHNLPQFMEDVELYQHLRDFLELDGNIGFQEIRKVEDELVWA